MKRKGLNIASKVTQITDANQWAVIVGKVASGTFTVRLRKSALDPDNTARHTFRLSVIWLYAKEGTGAMPDESDDNEMQGFEDRLIEAWEHDHTALLTAVVTFDGNRHWIFYTRDVDVCRKRIGEMTREAGPYPIELVTEEDPTWSYLTKNILVLVPWQEYQDEWQEFWHRTQTKWLHTDDPNSRG